MQQLSELEPAEVSLVPQGANNKKFLILKSMKKEKLLELIKSEPDCFPALEKVMKSFNDENEESLDDNSQAALRAIVKILVPFKETLSPVLKSALEVAGFDLVEKLGGKMDKKKASATQSPEEMEEEASMKAMTVAKAAYCEEMKKLGYAKYPTKDIMQKDLKSKKKDEDEDEDDEEEEMEKKGVKKSMSEEKIAVAKALNVSTGEVTPALEAIFKAHQELARNNKELTDRLSAVTKSAKRKEFVEKSKGFQNLTCDREVLADTLMSLSEKAPTELETIEKVLAAADAQVGAGSNLFGEIGTTRDNPAGFGMVGSWTNIEKAAQGFVQKSGMGKLSNEQAVDEFLKTDDGKKMYSVYDAEQMAAVRRN